MVTAELRPSQTHTHDKIHMKCQCLFVRTSFIISTLGLGCLILYSGNGLNLKGRFLNALSHYFCDTFVTKCGEKFSSSPNLVTNLVRNFVNDKI